VTAHEPVCGAPMPSRARNGSDGEIIEWFNGQSVSRETDTVSRQENASNQNPEFRSDRKQP
jgi:hypothetical protein